MRTVSIRLNDLLRMTLDIGFRGENERTTFLIDCRKLFNEYPTAVPSLAIKPPVGAPYPAVATRQDDIVRWVVKDSDLANEGNGELQLTFTVNNVVAKTYKGKFLVRPSILPTGSAPSAIDDWITEANAALNGIPQTIDDALAEAKASGEFDGFSPIANVAKVGDTATISITDKEGTTTATVKDGAKGDKGDTGAAGADGKDGTDGHSPVLTSSKSGKTTTIFSDGVQLAQIQDGQDGSGTNVIDDTAGAGDTDVTFSADKLTSDFSDVLNAITQKYTKPNTGIPSSDLASGVQTSLGKADTAYQLPSGGIPASDIASGVIPTVPVQDVQVNGTSVLSQGVANVPMASDSTLGVIKVYQSGNHGLLVGSDGELKPNSPNTSELKAQNNDYKPITPYRLPTAVFYGLATASGDTTQSASSNAVGTYTESALSSIHQMLDAPVTVSGSTPSITAKAGVRYICGEVSTLTIVVPASGIIDVTFESGSTATVLTITPPTGQTVKWANGFDPTALEANTTYELNILDGTLGVACSWT